MKTKKLFVMSLLAAGAIFAAAPALADHHKDEGEGEEKRFHLHGEIRARGEYTENYFDLEDDEAVSGLDDEFGYWPYRIRIAADGQVADNVRAYVEIQGAGFFGNEFPQKNDHFPPGQAFEFDDQDDMNLYQGFVELQKIGGSTFTARIGRQEHTYGTELLLGDNDHYAGTSFDGGRGWWDGERHDVNVFYYKTFEGNQIQGVGFSFDGSSIDQNLFGGTLDWEIGEDSGTFGAYLLRTQLLNIDTAWWDLGARYARMPDKDQAFDWNVELDLQNGEAFSGAFDIKAYIAEGWFGYSWGDSARHRVHVGALVASGDDTPADTDLEAFLPAFGDEHAYNRLGDSDFFSLSNITNWNVGYQVMWGEEKHYFRASLHQFTLTENPGLTEDDLGTEFDVKYGYAFAENTKLSVGLANLAIGDVFGPTADDVQRIYSQVKVRW